MAIWSEHGLTFGSSGWCFEELACWKQSKNGNFQCDVLGKGGHHLTGEISVGKYLYKYDFESQGVNGVFNQPTRSDKLWSHCGIFGGWMTELCPVISGSGGGASFRWGERCSGGRFFLFLDKMVKKHEGAKIPKIFKKQLFTAHIFLSVKHMAIFSNKRNITGWVSLLAKLGIRLGFRKKTPKSPARVQKSPKNHRQKWSLWSRSWRIARWCWVGWLVGWVRWILYIWTRLPRKWTNVP